MTTQNEFEETKVPIQYLNLKTKNDFNSDYNSFSDFKGVNNINLFESDDDEEGPFKQEESIDEKQTVFSVLPSVIKDKKLKINEEIQTSFKKRMYKPSLGEMIDDIEKARITKFEEDDQLD